MPLPEAAEDPTPSFFDVILKSNCEFLRVFLLLGSWLSEEELFEPVWWPVVLTWKLCYS